MTYRETWPHEYVLIKQDKQRELLAAICARIANGEGIEGRPRTRQIGRPRTLPTAQISAATAFAPLLQRRARAGLRRVPARCGRKPRPGHAPLGIGAVLGEGSQERSAEPRTRSRGSVASCPAPCGPAALGTDPEQSLSLPKTLVGRILPISQPIAEALARRRARRDPDSPLVFHRDGIPVRRWRTAWRTACQAAGVPTPFTT